jgi:hypothetical protein
MPNEIWYLALLILVAGTALVVPAVRRWDRAAPSGPPNLTRRRLVKASTAPPKSGRARQQAVRPPVTVARGAVERSRPS